MIATRLGAFVAVVALAFVASSHAEPTSAVKRPRGAVLDCPSGEASGAPGGTYRSENNLVVGPIAMSGAGLRPVEFRPDLGWQKFPTNVRSGHRVTVELPRDTWPHAGLVYGLRPRNPRFARWGYRVLTFIPCAPDTFRPNPYSHVACCFSFFSGGIRADAPQCVPLRFWVDDEPRPRSAVIYLGVRDCG